MIMKRKLKGTDLHVSRACFGTMTFGSQVDEKLARRMVDYCLERGINFFDTANVYQLMLRRSELLLQFDKLRMRGFQRREIDL